MNKYMRDWKSEIEDRVSYIYATVVDNAKAKGVILGLSGGKDCILASYLCKKAGLDVLGVSMPCGNMKKDEDDAKKYADMFGVQFKVIPLNSVYYKLLEEIYDGVDISIDCMASSNIKPRLRMTTLYAIGQKKNYLVCGTGNRSESTMGYFTKFGDGGYDFNPISDLTVTEIYDLLKYIRDTEGYELDEIINRVPSAGLYDGQTDELEMGISYKAIDDFLLNNRATKKDFEIIKTAYDRTMHKRWNVGSVYCFPPVADFENCIIK